jgi:class 3 adenylate cyclase
MARRGRHTALCIGTDKARLFRVQTLREIGLSLGHRRKLLTAIAQGRLAPPAAAPIQHTAEPERRQVTVMICDLVRSTELTQLLDPEEMSRIIREFQGSVAGAISRFDGFLDRFLGEGVLAFFGYPRAHEDAAERAVRSAFMALESIAAITTSAGEPISVRIAIASGSALFEGTVAYGAVREPVVVSEVVNLAARLQSVAPENAIVVSPRTRRLLHELFILDDLGPYDLKGIAQPVRVWRVIGERRAGTRFEAAHGPALAPIVGRDAKITLLAERWRSVREGEGQVVLLSGDAGMGKSRIAQVLRSHVAKDKHVVLSYQCSPYHRNSALHPVIAQLHHAARIRPGESAETRLQKIEALVEPGSSAEAIVLLADLLSVPVAPRYTPLDLSAEERKRKTLQVLLDQLRALARRQPVLMLVEDAHWIDPTTQELLSQGLIRNPRDRCL